MAEIDIAMEAWPVVVLKPASHVTVEDVESLAKRMHACYRRAQAEGRRVAVIVDATQMAGGAFAPDARARLAKLCDVSMQRFPGVRIAEAVVTDSSLVRATITAHYWLRQSIGLERETFTTLPEAREWAEQMLRHASDVRHAT